MASRIEDYALLGNCRTAALVSKEGAIDWLCFPRFDAPACFAALLGTPENGRWQIAPTAPVRRVSRQYLDGTMILETTFTTDEGEAKLIDFMPSTFRHSSVVRIVVGVRGRVAFNMDLVIRFDYGRTVPWVERHDPLTLTAVAGPDMLVLRTHTPIKARALHSTARFSVGAGERRSFTLTHQPSHEPVAEGFDPEASLAKTRYFWHEFSSRCPDVGPMSALVKRSLITLKALTYLPTGGIVAAATTSLPEQIGGQRNWDYRYCWLRDATMTLLAFMNMGYFEEASAWRDWLTRSVAGSPDQMQIMYGLGGERRLHEYELPWLCGYEDSQPVRIGNAAATQTQLDVFGEVADAMAQAIKGHLPRHPRIEAIAEVIVPFLEKAWRNPDEGIWEIRAAQRHFTHSKVMSWVAFDRIAHVAGAMENGQEFARNCRRIADEIHEEVCRRGFNADMNSFVQSYDSTLLDASLLQIPLTGFLPADDPRVAGTVAAIEKRLMRDGFLLRYETEHGVDGLPPGEGTFLVCSFWLADVYVLLGRDEDARELFTRLAGLCNDVGLLAEQYDPLHKRMLGNFPQAFSHVGIINTALNLHRVQAPAQERAHA
ncbi:glycoside hydrolase family 15 protein [Parapusillimonas granuli]|uniref:Glycoside hydrolase family 15 protein n=1 Tax=Parapusillimonas granuli TaxID=380911 RepID=A0A853FZ03_9BURK|nr:glycoside hydrolase family 15 protein [Parapusillimonas granuli]MBB5214211.1 GH15 family glucan-1,4-alpha-glucosidase [Parapusillimonas granuli]MEB2399038.1 glycoside hydrolase family 15 protein [Alcaligenaceae bacterium]NYT51315.1 glycoside hydrolase family 15 protein [Parapusillimonas granuli]